VPLWGVVPAFHVAGVVLHLSVEVLDTVGRFKAPPQLLEEPKSMERERFLQAFSKGACRLPVDLLPWPAGRATRPPTSTPNIAQKCRASSQETLTRPIRPMPGQCPWLHRSTGRRSTEPWRGSTGCSASSGGGTLSGELSGDEKRGGGPGAGGRRFCWGSRKGTTERSWASLSTDSA